MKTAIIYVREINGENTEARIEQCRSYSMEHGFVPVTAVVDLHMPGPAYRLGLRGVMDMVGAGDVAALITIAAEQLSKDPVRLQALQETLGEKNCQIHYVSPDQRK